MIVAVVLATTLSRAADFKFPTQTLRVPDGFTVELVAGPPSVNRPISIAFDPQGRLYATDSSGLSDRAPVQIEKKPHRIVRLADKDGDGRFETAVVFAENMMFPQGALFHDGSLFVAAPPQIWKLTDTDGDGLGDACDALPLCGAASAGSCCVLHLTPACNDATCCEIVCGTDPFCCNNQWDSICVNEAGGPCNNACQCTGGG